jgi:transmembrane sensor
MDNSYTNYSIEDFAVDEAFIDWVLIGKNDDKWQTWMVSHLYLQNKIEEAKKIVLELKANDVEVPDHLSKSIWSSITKKIHKPKDSYSRRLVYMTAAACVALVLMLLPFKQVPSNNDFETIVNNSLETDEFVLPDNSYVYLDEKASIQFDKIAFEKERTLQLTGQAFFNVQKGERFVVKTKEGSVKVLGTSFNVEETKDNFSVICYTGKVEVSYKGKTVLLVPGEKSDFNQPTNKSTIELKDEIPMWVAGTVTFDNENLKEVLSTVKSIYKVEIKIDDKLLYNQKYTGKIVKNDLNKALKSITWPLHLKYTLEGDEIQIQKQ